MPKERCPLCGLECLEGIDGEIFCKVHGIIGYSNKEKDEEGERSYIG